MKLFVIEGIDGSGKSTQIKLFSKYIATLGLKYEYLHFPRTDTPYFGELIARFLRGEFGSINEVNPWIVAMLYAGDRKDASEQIKKWMDSGSIVLLDRYTFSNIAYQCAKIDDACEQTRLMKWILDLEFNHFAIPRPDLNLFLDVPFSFTEKELLSKRKGNDRKYLMGGKDIHEESLSFQRKVRDIYMQIPEKDDSMSIVDCSDENGEMSAPEEIFKRILKIVNEKKLL